MNVGLLRMRGPIVLETVNSFPDVLPENLGRIILNENDNRLYYQTDTEWALLHADDSTSTQFQPKHSGIYTPVITIETDSTSETELYIVPINHSFIPTEVYIMSQLVDGSGILPQISVKTEDDVIIVPQYEIGTELETINKVEKHILTADAVEEEKTIKCIVEVPTSFNSLILSFSIHGILIPNY